MAHSIILKKYGRAELKEHSASIVPLFEGFKKTDLPEDFHKYFEMLERDEFEAMQDKIVTYNDGTFKVSFIGLGKKRKFHIPKVFNVFGNALREDLDKYRNIYIFTDSFFHVIEREEIITELVQVVELTAYNFTKYKTQNNSKVKNQEIILFLDRVGTEDKETKEMALFLAEGVMIARDLGNEPANIATPEYLAYFLKSRERELNIDVEIFDEKKIQEIGMNLLYAVGKGSDDKPFFVKISYFGDKHTKRFHAIVGKGLSFDTGGLQVKPDLFMSDMKGDMSGAATVIGTLYAIGKMKLNVNVVGYLPLLQNMPDGKSYHPDDIFTAYNGKTVEVVHTDAEGRLALADALAFASEENPIEIIDLATLTGAVVVALGWRYAGIMGNNEELTKELIDTGKSVDEKLWHLPLPDEYKESIKGDLADYKNLEKNKFAGTSIAGMFLKEFVKESIPWAHIDMASVFLSEANKGIFRKNQNTGFGVRLLVEYLKRKVEEGER